MATALWHKDGNSLEETLVRNANTVSSVQKYVHAALAAASGKKSNWYHPP
jgi:hypothetical protein